MLAVDVLYDRSLEDAGETLENSTTLPTTSIFIDVYNRVGLGVSMTLNACRVFAVLLTRDHHSSHCGVTRSSPGMRWNLIEIGLLLRHLVKISDQVRNFRSLLLLVPRVFARVRSERNVILLSWRLAWALAVAWYFLRLREFAFIVIESLAFIDGTLAIWLNRVLLVDVVGDDTLRLAMVWAWWWVCYGAWGGLGWSLPLMLLLLLLE